MRTSKGKKTIRFVFRRSGEILVLAAGMAFLAGLGPGNGTVLAAQVSQPEGYDDEAWGHLLDDTLEYDEIPDLIEYFNPSYRSALESVEGNLQDSYDMAEDMREEAKEYRQQAKAMEDEGDAITAAQYKAMGKALQDAASSTEKALDSQKKKLDRYTLEPIRKQLASAAQSLFIGYNQMVKNQALLEKTVELYTDMLSSSQVQTGIGMATSTDLLSAQIELTSAQNQLTALNNNIDSMRRTLIMLTGWDYMDNPVIGEVPAVDVSRTDAIDLEADKVTAIAYNSSLISLKNTEPDSRSLKDIHSKERSVEEAENKLRSTMDTLYNNLQEKRLALQAAETAYQQAKLTWEGNQRRYQLGMLGKTQYLGTEIQYIQALAARDTADMNMLQALNEYDWAVKGVASIE